MDLWLTASRQTLEVCAVAIIRKDGGLTDAKEMEFILG